MMSQQLIVFAEDERPCVSGSFVIGFIGIDTVAHLNAKTSCETAGGATVRNVIGNKQQSATRIHPILNKRHILVP